MGLYFDGYSVCTAGVCMCFHPVQTCAAFQLPKANGQNLVNELILEMLLFAQFLTTFQVAALI